jgi:glyoxylase-like metal-dependent hydrolase (beta-lactamase superfamily II)
MLRFARLFARFSFVAPAVCAVAVLCHTSASAANAFTSRLLADNIHLVTGSAGNTLVAVDTDGLVLVEGVPAAQAADYLAFVKQLTGTDHVKTLINTHWHDESVGLNASLAGHGTEIVAHANTRQWLGATIRRRGEEVLHTPVPKAQLPTRVFHDTLSLPFRGATLELGYLLHAHTDGDIYAYFPQQNVLFTGPAVRTDKWSSVDESTNGFIGGLMDAYDELATLVNDKTVIVPESGVVIAKPAFDEQMAMYKNLMKEMVTLLRQSRSAEEVVIANPAVGLKPEWGDPSEFLDQGFRSFYGHLREGRHVGTMP